MEAILKSNSFAEKINDYAIMYAREGPDMDETVVVRNYFPNTNYKNFGFKGRDTGRSLIIKFVALCKSMRREIVMKFGEKEFKELIDSLAQDIEDIDVLGLDVYEEFNGKSIRINDNIKLSIFRTKGGNRYVQLGVFNTNEKGESRNGVFFFMSDAIKFVRYINKRFDLKISALGSKIVSHETDDFF